MQPIANADSQMVAVRREGNLIERWSGMMLWQRHGKAKNWAGPYVGTEDAHHRDSGDDAHENDHRHDDGRQRELRGRRRDPERAFHRKPGVTDGL